MVSKHKFLIRAAEMLALAGGIAACVIGAGARLGLIQPARIEPFVVPMFLLGFFVFFVAVLLFHEFATVLHGKPSSSFKEQELSFAEVKLLVSWCPAPLKLAFLAAGGLFAFTIFRVGAVEWSSGQPFTSAEAQGFPLYTAIFMLLSVPVLASSSRMPGTFEENLRNASVERGAA